MAEGEQCDVRDTQSRLLAVRPCESHLTFLKTLAVQSLHFR